MRNLSAEMARYGVSKEDLRMLLSCTDKTVNNKLNDTTEFSISEAMKVRDKFFPGMRLEYLFSQNISSAAQQTTVTQ